ncbi:MAG TPA: ABC transporter permease [Solirubrobacteraceae bacterium]|jgi:putative ABC transport system permease protein
MIGLETLRIAVDGLLANRLRSSLTILGLGIGVASVIVLIAVGNGSSQTVQKRIESLGTNVLLVTRGFQRGGARASVATPPLTEKAALALQDPNQAPDVKSAAPVVNAASATLVAGGTSYSPSTFVGTTPSYLTTHDYELAAGAPFSAADVTNHSAVVVIGPTVAENLFPGANPVGQSIQINGSSFQVIGVTKSKGASGALNQDDVAMAPISTVQDKLTGYGAIDSITVQAANQGKLNAAEGEVSAILQQQLGTTAANPGFNIINQGSILEASSSTSNVFTTLLGEVAAISLLVGGIGVMNIMLVSVTERTREIGIRKAIGARHSDILGQFLMEAVLVSTIGGLLGLIVGVLGTQFEIAGVQPVIAGYSIPLAFSAAVATGLFFGTYPAGRAAGLRPIEALRHE